MAQQMRNLSGRGDRKLTLIAVMALLLTVTCLFLVLGAQESSQHVEQPAVVTAAGDGDGPRIVGGFVPERRFGPPVTNNEFRNFLSWDIINGLFALIFALEFLIFPVLFWLWFGKQETVEQSHEESEKK